MMNSIGGQCQGCPHPRHHGRICGHFAPRAAGVGDGLLDDRPADACTCTFGSAVLNDPDPRPEGSIDFVTERDMTEQALTVWGNDFAAQIRDHAILDPRSLETGHPRVIPGKRSVQLALRLHDHVTYSPEDGSPALLSSSDTELLRDLLNAATRRGYLDRELIVDEAPAFSDGSFPIPFNDSDQKQAIFELAHALRLTAEYCGSDVLPAIEGWSWYDALKKWAPEQLQGFEPPEPLR